MAFVNAVLLTAMIASNGVVVSMDSKGAESGHNYFTIGKHSIIAASGPPALTLRSPDGVSINYSFSKMATALKAQLPPDPTPARVAESARTYLAKAFARYPFQALQVGDISVLVAGTDESHAPSVWTIRVLLSSKSVSPPVIKEQPKLVVGKPWPAGFGFTHDPEGSWRKYVPASLVVDASHDKPQYSLSELAEISAWMIAIEIKANRQASLPVEQIFFTNDGNRQHRFWNEPRPRTLKTDSSKDN